MHGCVRVRVNDKFNLEIKKLNAFNLVLLNTKMAFFQ